MTRITVGALRHRVVLQTHVTTPVAGGGAVVTWQDAATLWASVAGVRGREDVHADALRGNAMFDVTIRYRAGVGTANRFIHDGRVLDVRSVFDPDGRRRWLVCRCEAQEL